MNYCSYLTQSHSLTSIPLNLILLISGVKVQEIVKYFMPLIWLVHIARMAGAFHYVGHDPT